MLTKLHRLVTPAGTQVVIISAEEHQHMQRHIEGRRYVLDD